MKTSVRSKIESCGHPYFSQDVLGTPEGLRSARRKQGLSQVDLADMLRISQSNISRWENGYEGIPARMARELATLLSDQRGALHPYIKQLAKRDDRISILQFERVGFFIDSRWLHFSKLLSEFFDLPQEQAFMSLSSHYFDAKWRPVVYGSGFSNSQVAIDFERDCVRQSHMGEARSCRLRSQQFIVDCENYAVVAISVSTILGNATGAPAVVHQEVEMADLPAMMPVARELDNLRRNATSTSGVPIWYGDRSILNSAKAS